MTSWTAYEDAWRDSDIGKDLKKVRNVKPLWSRFGTILGVGLGGFDMWTNTLFGFSLFGTLKHGKADYASLDPASQHEKIVYPKGGRGAHLRPAVLGVPVEYQPRGEPADPSAGEGHGAAAALRARRLRRSLDAVLSGGGL